MRLWRIGPTIGHFMPRVYLKQAYCSRLPFASSQALYVEIRREQIAMLTVIFGQSRFVHASGMDEYREARITPQSRGAIPLGSTEVEITSPARRTKWLQRRAGPFAYAAISHCQAA